ncbi:HlyD family efflux transporter periplasmic adaptor subunit [Pseudomonas sp. LS1212]|uniref:HlyD family secretion protein n=1 Tax=Pseudomonas sp. LS1212 TaxID=2972478 RepID=UPI00215D433B|nr:HlyD family efflux transporter periplasmic adaptor subunit [Pseudomonas sp. LS1212]UVJ44494.1 HlyD family efflux transporter periplasmic adaptor subunit [Pseudomonas sp. LS1212]
MADLSGENTSLFRTEVISFSRQQGMGHVLIHQPWGYRVATALAGVLILLILAFGYFGTYTRKATVNGLLVPENGMLRLTASSTGLLTDVKVVEGQQVKAGEVLFIISGERLSIAGGTQKLISEQLNQRLLLMERNRALADDRLAGQVRMADSRLAVISEELRQFQEEIRLLKRRTALAQAHLERQQELVRAGFISIAQLQQAEAEQLTIKGQQQSIQRARNSLNRERTELLAQRQDMLLRHQSEISEVDRGIALVRQEQVESDVRSEQVVVSPFDGLVTGVSVQRGQHVAAGTLIASLIPHGAILSAHIYFDSRRVGFIEAGQPVLLRYAAYPYQKFGMGRGGGSRSYEKSLCGFRTASPCCQRHRGYRGLN